MQRNVAARLLLFPLTRTKQRLFIEVLGFNCEIAIPRLGFNVSYDNKNQKKQDSFQKHTPLRVTIAKPLLSQAQTKEKVNKTKHTLHICTYFQRQETSMHASLDVTYPTYFYLFIYLFKTLYSHTTKDYGEVYPTFHCPVFHDFCCGCNKCRH